MSPTVLVRGGRYVRPRSRTPILVTGAPRSGTTILGTLLALPHTVSQVYEPLNAQIGLRAVPRQFWYVRAGSRDEDLAADTVDHLLAGQGRFRCSGIPGATSAAREALRRTLVSRTNVTYQLSARSPLRQRWLLKDPMATMSAEWLHQRYEAPTVITVRHPAATVASYLRLRWRFSMRVLQDQRELMDDHLGDLLGPVDATAIDPVTEGALLWRSCYTVLSAYAERNPNIRIVRNEDLCRDPDTTLRRLYGWLGLDLTPRIEQRVRAYTKCGRTAPIEGKVHTLHRDSAKALNGWRSGVDTASIEKIRAITEPIASQWYGDADW